MRNFLLNYVLCLFIKSIKSYCIPSADGGCYYCAWNFYNLEEIKFPLHSFSENNCTEKLPFLKQNIFLSASKCITKCDGSYENPFNKFGVALNYIYELSIKYLFSKINVFFMDGDFYLLKKELEPSSFSSQYFKRVSIDILFSPLLCSIMNITGCFTDNSLKTTIHLKTDEISFIIAQNLTMKNLIFDGSDITLQNGNVTTSCYNMEQKCCIIEGLINPNSSCYLTNYVVSKVSETILPKTGLFTIESIIDFDVPLFPSLNIINCDFMNINSVKSNSGFYAFISVANTGGTININDVVMINSFFHKGIIASYSWEFTPSYEFFNASSASSAFFVMQNEFLTVSLIKFSLKNYNFFNLTAPIIQFIQLDTFPSIVSISNCSFDSAFNSKTTNYPLFTLSNCALTFSGNVILKNIQNFGFLSASSNSQISFLNLIIFQFLSFDKNFVTISSSQLFFINSSFSNILLSNKFFQITNSSISLFNSTIFSTNSSDFFIVDSSIINITSSSFDQTSIFDYFSVSKLTNFTISNTSIKNLINKNYDMFSTNLGDNFYIDKLKMKNITHRNLFTGGFSSSHYLFNSFFEILNVNFFQSFNFFPYKVEHENVTWLNITAQNIISVSESAIMGSSYAWYGRRLYFLNSTITYYFVLCVWYRNVTVLDSIIQNVLHNNVRGLNTFEGGENIKFITNNLTINQSGELYPLDYYHIYRSAYYVYNFDTDLQNIFINFSSSFGMDTASLAVGGSKLNFKNITILRVKNSDTTVVGLYIYQFSIINLENIILMNMNCPTRYDSIMNSHGAINLLGSSVQSEEINSRIATLKNITIDSCNCQKSSGIFALNINQLIITNLTIINSVAKVFSSHLLIYYSSNLFLKDIFSSNSSGGECGSLYFNTINNISIFNLTLNYSFGIKSGAVKIINSNAKLQNIIIQTSKSQTYGGSFFIDSSSVEFQNLTLNVSSSETGGGIYVSKGGKFFLNQALFNNLTSQVGGSLYIDSLQNGTLMSIISNNSQSLIKGSFIFVMEGDIISFFNCTIQNTTNLNSIGNIFILTQEYSQYTFDSIICSNINLIEGSCFYFYTESSINVTNSSILNCNGGAIFLFSRNYINITLSNFIIYFHNIRQIALNVFEPYFLLAEYINLRVSNFTLMDSKFGNIFQLNFCKSQIKNIIQTNISSFETYNSVSFNIYSGKMNVSNCSISSFLKATNNYIVNLDSLTSSFYNLTIDTFFTLLSNFQIKKSNFILKNANFYNVIGSIAIFEITNSNCSFDSCFINIDSNGNINKSMVFNVQRQLSLDLFSIELQNLTVIASENLECGLIKDFSQLILNNSNLSLLQNQFLNFRYNFSGFQILDCQNHFIQNSSFYYLVQNYGGAFYISNSQSYPSIIMIKECTFLGGLGILGGAVYIDGNSFLTIINSKFLQNSVIDGDGHKGMGGGIFINCYLKSSNCQNNFSGNIFQNNSASFFADSIFSKSPLVSQNLGELYNIGKNQIISYPVKLLLFFELLSLEFLSNESLIQKLIKEYLPNNPNTLTIVSGVPFNFTIIEVDNLNQVIIFDNSSSAYLELSSVTYSNQTDENYKGIKIERGSSTCQKGYFFFENIVITAAANTNMTVNANFLIELKGGEKNEVFSITQRLSLNFYIRVCLRGEILKFDLSCFKCQPGTFSIINPMTYNGVQECFQCPDNANCPGGDIIIPKLGFWRSSEDSILIQQCVTKEACDVKFDNISGLPILKCNPKYTGNFCFDCEIGFARLFLGGTCDTCNENFFSYFKLIMVILALTIFVVLQVRYYLMLNENDNPFLGVMIKIFVNHFQQLSLITLINLGWTTEIKNSLSFLFYLSFLSQDLFNTDCIFTKIGYNVYFFSVLFSNLLPFIVTIISMLFWIIFKFYKNKKKLNTTFFKLTKELKITLSISLYILYPNILKICFDLFNCRKIDEKSNQLVLSNAPNISCFSNTHLYWIVFLGIPGFFFWGLLSNSFYLILMIKNKRYLKLILGKSPNFQKSITSLETRNPLYKQKKN